MMEHYDEALRLNRYRSFSFAALLTIYGYGLVDTLLLHSTQDVLKAVPVSSTTARVHPTLRPASEGIELGLRLSF
jgi:hypothetical protein